jgi:hypothetical protein
MKYTTFRACERFGITPPGIASRWDDCNNWARIELIAYQMVREIESSGSGSGSGSVA